MTIMTRKRLDILSGGGRIVLTGNVGSIEQYQSHDAGPAIRNFVLIVEFL